MYFSRISNLFSFDKFRPNIHNIYKEGLYDKTYHKRPFQSSNFYSNKFYSLNSTNYLIPVQKVNTDSNTDTNFDKYKRNFRYFAYLAGTSYIFTNNKSDDSNKGAGREDYDDDDLSTIVSSESDLSTADPFDDDDVVYYYKNYSYESPSKDNKYYYEIKRYKYSNDKMEELPESMKRDIDSLIVNPFYNYFKRIKDNFHQTVFNLTPIVYSSGEDGENKWNKMEPFWVVLSNTSPTTFGNAFMMLCGVVFAMWKLSENTVNNVLADFMTKHFLASYESIKAKRYHTLITSAISHSSFLHFGLNCMFFHQLMKTFQTNMSFQSGQAVNSTLQSFVRSIFGGNHMFDFGNKVRPVKNGRVSTNDIFNVLCLSGVISSLGHVLLYKTPVLGASGAVSGLMYLLASTFPNSYFRTVFPLPGLNLSILQVGQIFVATNLYFLLNGRGPNIAWAAHLIGMGAGALYCLFQQYVNRRPGFHNPITLSIKTAKSQWKSTFKGIKYVQ